MNGLININDIIINQEREYFILESKLNSTDSLLISLKTSGSTKVLCLERFCLDKLLSESPNLSSKKSSKSS